MTAPPSSDRAAPETRDNPVRHPVRVDTDGDFTLDDLLALPAHGPARRLDATTATRAALWQLHPDPAKPTLTAPPRGLAEHGAPTPDDAALLHRVETAGLFRPPVAERVAALTPAQGAAWLGLAAHWIELSRSCGDLRLLNTACKLTGAVWLHHQPATRGGWREPDLTGQLAALGRLLHAATDHLRGRLADRVLLAEPAPPPDPPGAVAALSPPGRARIVVLAGAGSRSAARLVAAATTAGIPIDALCWYTPPPGPAVASNYASAWYPPAAPDPAPHRGVPDTVPTTRAATWDQVRATIRAASADLVLLVAMPIVPAPVLDTARLGIFNAHNGGLPSYRGMDAVGWALLGNQPIVCSLHLARAAVDAGELVATQPVPVAPVRTLAARVKTTQLRLLLAGAAHVAATGALPDLTPQPPGGTLFYRLHPHLKRVLDASPYARDDHPQWTVTH